MFSNVVHHFTRDPGTKQYKVTRVTPLTRLSQYGESVFLQGGKIYDAAGVELKVVPAWAYDQMAKLTPRGLKEAGFEQVPAKPKDAPEFIDPEQVDFKKSELDERRRNTRK